MARSSCLVVLLLLGACAPSPEQTARIQTESGTQMNARYVAADGLVTVSIVHSMPSLYAGGNQNEQEMHARAPRMRDFARSALMTS